MSSYDVEYSPRILGLSLLGPLTISQYIQILTLKQYVNTNTKSRPFLGQFYAFTLYFANNEMNMLISGIEENMTLFFSWFDEMSTIENDSNSWTVRIFDAFWISAFWPKSL